MKEFKRLKIIALFIAVSILTTACSLPGLEKKIDEGGLVVTSGTTTEMQILGHAVAEMIEHYTDKKVGIISNLGSSILNHQALTRGDANIAGVKYTGTEITGILQMDPITDPEKAMKICTEEYDKNLGMKWYKSYGFNNTYAFMVTKEFSEKNGVTKISDLKDMAADLTAGVDTSWINREGDGYEDFKKAYDFDFKRVYPMQIGLVYDAVQANQMDVVLGYSTDGRIASYELVVLEDDLNFFPSYDAAPVINKKVLEDYPEVDDIIKKLEGKITPEIMRELNYKSDNDLIEPKNIAIEFLEENNYFEKEDE
ncbi:MAG: osmoprotectant ABC transporter substrate-binding protein [Andreesenia angusta]|nr:osmoprotectant ABC transporter substrate-binding protein [Andreesenia angusta]